MVIMTNGTPVRGSVHPQSHLRLVDLSVAVEAGPSEPVPVQIDVVSHEEGADILGRPGGIDRTAFPDGCALSLEHVKLTSHTATHIDAPSHYGPMCEGRPARSIDQLPLDWFFGPGILLTCRGDDATAVSLEEVRRKLDRLSRPMAVGDIVLIDTGAYERWGTPEYFTDFRGVSVEATRFLVESGAKVIGVDSFGFDPPFHRMLDAYAVTGDQSVLWPAHMYGREREYCQIERLSNLRAIGRAEDFHVACFPIKITGAGAGWSRVVAMVPQNPTLPDPHAGMTASEELTP